MKLTSLSIRNFRTIDTLDLSFPVSYAALCGPNDSGKTNVIRAIRAMMKDDDEGSYFPGDDEAISVKDDYPKWSDTRQEDRAIHVSLQLQIGAERDAGLYQFLLRQLKLESTNEALQLRLDASY
jgi:putative ATP-dependent endonuclease of the OLD family